MSQNIEPKCNCYEDCNGIWGTPNQDKCYGCCWSVGDKVKYTHDWRGEFEVKWGGITQGGGPFCVPSHTCGTSFYSGMEEGLIELEYVCVGARGNYHSAGTTDTPPSDPRLPLYIHGRSWAGEPTASLTKDGWNVVPLVAIPECNIIDVDGTACDNDVCCCVTPPNSESFCNRVEYITNLAYIPGCAELKTIGNPTALGWPYKFIKRYIGFEAIQGEGDQLFWSPVSSLDTNQEIKIGGGTPRSCCCGDESPTVCPALACVLDGWTGNEDAEGWIQSCTPLKWNGSTDDPRLMMDTSEFCTCFVNDEGELVKMVGEEEVPCDCYNDPSAILWNDPCDPDPAPWPGPSGPIPDCEPCKRRYRINHTATVFALNLEDERIKYCANQGYWIEGQIRNKWFKYKVYPFLIMTCRPVLEWECNCVDDVGEPLLKDVVCENIEIPSTDDTESTDESTDNSSTDEPEIKNCKKEIFGGYNWYFWTGNCDCDPRTECGAQCGISSILPCVQSCQTFNEPFAGFGIEPGNLVPSSAVNDDDGGPWGGASWVPWGLTSTSILSGENVQDFFLCTNCAEGIASCSGYKAYCVRRTQTRPLIPGSCAGECSGYYGLELNPEQFCPEFQEGTLQVRCNHGTPASTTQGTINYPCSGVYCDRWLNSNSLSGAFPVMRSECVPMFVHTINIEPVESDERRCKWYEWEKDGKQYRCCGKPQNNETVEGEDVGTLPPLVLPEPLNGEYPNGYVFSWTETGSSGSGGKGWPSEQRAKELCQEVTDICPPGSSNPIFGTGCEPSGGCDCDKQPACGGTQDQFYPLDENGSTPCSLATCHRGACITGRPGCPVSKSNLWNVQSLDFVCNDPNDPNCDSLFQDNLSDFADIKTDSNGNQFYVFNPNATLGGFVGEEEILIPVSAATANKIVGCNCVPPACLCCTGGDPEQWEPGSGDCSPIGRWQLPEDTGRCNPNNYSRFSPHPCISGCNLCVSDPDTCVYKGCTIGEDNPTGCAIPEPLCPGQQPFLDGCPKTGECPILYCVPTGNFGFLGWTCEEECPAGSTPGTPITGLTGNVKFGGNPVPGANISNDADDTETTSDENGNFKINIQIPINTTNISLFILKFIDGVGFVGGSLNVVNGEGGIIFGIEDDTGTFNDVGEIELEELETEINPEDFCVICTYECLPGGPCPGVSDSCLVAFVDKTIEDNCPTGRVIECSPGNPFGQSCQSPLKEAELVLCDNTNNPNSC
jgi:hypothetical protein